MREIGAYLILTVPSVTEICDIKGPDKGEVKLYEKIPIITTKSKLARMRPVEASIIVIRIEATLKTWVQWLSIIQPL